MNDVYSKDEYENDKARIIHFGELPTWSFSREYLQAMMNNARVDIKKRGIHECVVSYGKNNPFVLAYYLWIIEKDYGKEKVDRIMLLL